MLIIKISTIYNVYDIPDNKRKKHKKPISLLGGLLILINLILYCFAEYYEISNLNFFENKNEILIFLFCSLCFFLVGFVDDKYNLRPNLKLFIYILIILILIIFDKDLIIKNITFTFTDFIFYFHNLSFFFTILCFLLFINSLNMLDGINGQAASYTIFISLIMFFLNINANFFIGLIIPLSIFLYFNFKDKMFLGDSGTILLGFIISYFFIKSYNLGFRIYADEIFLIMMIPGFELLRLAIQRLVKNKHPFSPDNNHIHHLMINKTNFLNSYLAIQSFLIFPFLSYLLIVNSIFSLVISLIFYVLIIKILSLKK